MAGGSERVVLWLSLALGLLGLASPFLAPHGDGDPPPERRRLVPVVGSGLLLALLARLGTQGTHFPFEPGQRLGSGFLAGAAAALLFLLVASTARAGAPALTAAACGAVTAAAACLLLLYPGYPNPALAGLPVGLATLLLFTELLSARAGEEPSEPSPLVTRRSTLSTASTAGFLFSIALSASVLLAIARYGDMPRAARLAAGEKLWWAVPVLFAAAAVLGQSLAVLLRRGALLAAGLSGVTALAVLAILFSLLHGTGSTGATVPAWGACAWLILPFAAGWLTAVLYAALARAASAGDNGAGAQATTNSDAVLALPAVLAVFMLLVLLGAAYRAPAGALAAAASAPTLAGYGIALAALGFLLGAGPQLGTTRMSASSSVPPPHPDPEDCPAPGVARDGEGPGVRPPDAPGLLPAAALLAVAAAFRLFYVAYDLDESGIRLAAHYTLIGLLLGAVAPFVMAVVNRLGQERGWNAVPRGLLLAALAGLLPALLVVFWGVRAGGGLIVGLTAGFGFVALAQLLEPRGEGAAGRLAAALPVIPAALVALVTLQALTPLDAYATHWPRAFRVVLVSLLALLFPVAAVLLSRANKDKAR